MTVETKPIEDFADSWRRDVAFGLPKETVLANLRRHLSALEKLPPHIEHRETAIQDIKRFIAELEKAVSE